MTIRELATPYGEDTHVRLVLLDLDKGVAHFKRGHFEGDVPSMPWSGEELPANWQERNELNTAPLPPETASITAAMTAISEDLQNHS